MPMDEQLKVRLLGAAVLVGLGVIFIPMLLGPSPEPEAPLAAAPAPPAPAPAPRPRGKFASDIVVIGSPTAPPARGPAPAATTGTPVPPAPAPAATTGTPVPPAPAPAPAPSSAPTSDPKPDLKLTKVPESAPAPESAGGGWVVQLGSFSDRSNAIALRDRLRTMGHRSFVRTAKSSRGEEMTRVLVGPAASEAAATETAARLREATGLAGLVRRDPGK